MSAGWGLYVTGRFVPGPPESGAPSDPTDLRDELKFTELVAAVLRSLLQMRHLQKQVAGLTQFFAPAVLDAVAGDDPHRVLAPREAAVSVMFCDLRGFSRESEKYAHDLMGLLERISEALGVMTYHILDQGGVVGDFQGDAAMGFWGWPLGHTDIVARACRAALAIRAKFEASAKRAGDPLADFRMGIGIATGRAVAGRIGTVDQAKVTVFGPVVNLASRLEGMTKIFRAPILLDETTANVVGEKLGPDYARLRRVAKVKPYGLDTTLTVSELLPPVDILPELQDDDLTAYERALDAFLAGHWTEAFDLLHQVPPNDRVKDFLTVYIAQHNRTPPANWNGVIELTSKS
jgi:adenylate cyclase